MDRFLLDLLVCPACQGPLRWALREVTSDHIESGVATCTVCGGSYPIRDGIAIFLTPEVPREDLWEGAETALSRLLRENPAVAQELLSTPLEHLNPADQFYRAMAFEAKGDFDHAEEAERLSMQGLYTRGYLDCWERQVSYLIDHLRGTSEPIIDLASGRCILVERMLRELDCPIVATDFSVSAMRRNRAWLLSRQLNRRLSLLVLDARRMPFKTRSLQAVTTNLGLPNIENPADAAREIRRVLAGTFLAITHFYPPKDGNAEAIRGSGLADFLYHEQAIHLLETSGLTTFVRNACRAAASPTPVGAIIAGAHIDRLPAEHTELEWCVLEVA